MTNNAYAEQQQQARDLRLQLGELQREDSQEILFQEWSPGRKMQRLWSMLDGMMIEIPRYMVGPALMKRGQTATGFLWTANQSEAPTFVEGNVRCFLAADSPEREVGLLEQAGLAFLPPCPAKGLRSEFSKEQHAKNRHSQSWLTLQTFIQRQEREDARAEQAKQTDAMMRLAGMQIKGKTVVLANSPQLTCDCGWQTPIRTKSPEASLRTHQNLHCPIHRKDQPAAEEEGTE